MNMEVEQSNPNCHTKTQADDNDRGNWRRRLRHRKSSALPHTVKSPIEEKKVDKELAQESQNDQKDHQVLDSASRKLTFTCTNCKDGTRFSPDALLKHFKNFHGGKGHPPSFLCDICSFAAPDFTTLQQHYLKHKHSRLTCETCNGKGLQTPTQLTKHCKTHNNQYQCEKGKFPPKEFAHFLHNSCPQNTVPALDSSEKSELKPVIGALNRNFLADDAVEPQKDVPLKKIATPCQRLWIRKNWWKNRDVAPKQLLQNNDVAPKLTAADTKFLIPKSEIRWTTAKFLPFSAAGLLDENGELLHPTRTLEETKQFLERTVNCGKKWPVTLKGEPGPLLSESKMKQCATPLPVLNSGNELSGLMEKNNISVPPDCTTRVVGFKTVDGKKHLVLKVIPSAKLEVSSDTRKEIINRIDKQLDPHIERANDQMCSETGNVPTADSTFNGYDSTSTSRQVKKQGLGEEDDQDTMTNSPQVDNTEHDCSDDQSLFTLGPDAGAHLTLSGIEDVFDVETQTKNEKTAPSEVMVNANDTNDLSGETTGVSGEEHSVRVAHIPSLQTNNQKITDTPKQTDNPEKAASDCKEMNSEPYTSQEDKSRVEALSSSILCASGSMEEGINSQLFTLMSEKERSSEVNMKYNDKKSGGEAPVIHSPLDDWNEQKTEQVLMSPKTKNGVESNVIDPPVASPAKNTTDSLFISTSEHDSLHLQDSGDENINNIDNISLDQTRTVETVEETYLSQLSPEDFCHNPDLYQTLEELPVSTLSHLFDDSDVAQRGITSQGEPGSMAMHSTKAIPVAVSNDKASSQLPLKTEPTTNRKRQREPNTKDNQGLVVKFKRRLVRNSQDSSGSIPYWEPARPEIERTLRLFPVRSSQAVKVPRLNQPVVVLNHPDTDIPEVSNIMRSVHRHKGAVQRVVLSQGTLKALSELNRDTFRNIRTGDLQSSRYRRVWPPGTVKERFILNLKLKRLGRNKFMVSDLSSNANQIQSSFRCWFCGRRFRNQEVWVGHGQRHIMEATRDWNKLFSSEMQGNGADQQSFN
ncbi:zinc finger protein 518A [Tachysurus vachellii]|uniref:zinc finger protein 518A n=1 Tax=Tachysurus vachellii TaxID=175792 RepID=UPI00296B2494|nr:zinc finger protein 518A [Tachysurus vachellii]